MRVRCLLKPRGSTYVVVAVEMGCWVCGLLLGCWCWFADLGEPMPCSTPRPHIESPCVASVAHNPGATAIGREQGGPLMSRCRVMSVKKC